MSHRLFSFVGSPDGCWKVRSQRAWIGDPLSAVRCVEVVTGDVASPAGGWSLRGVTSNDRYVVRAEKQALAAAQKGLNRPEATFAALIPIRKSGDWWSMTQDERRHVFEEQSRHIAIGMEHLPPVARRLHHCRDLAAAEPFDFLTWFEYAPAYERRFEDLLAALRASAEWTYVAHEVDIRLYREP